MVDNYSNQTIYGNKYFMNNIGIGKTNPTYKLDVLGTFHVSTDTVVGHGIYLVNGGNVGIGTTNPDAAFQIRTTYNDHSFAVYTGASGEVQVASLSGTGNRAVYSTNNGVLTNSSSDRNLKTNINTLNNSLNKILKLRGVTYYWKNKKKMGSQKEIGLIAQEVQKEYPELVGTNSDKTLSIDYPKITAILIEAIKELEKQNKDLIKRIEELEKK